VRRSGRRGAAVVVGLVAAVGLAAVAADLVVVATRGTGALPGSVPVVGGLRPVDPADAGSWLAELPSRPVAAWPAVAVLTVLGAVLLHLGVRAGGRRRRVLSPASGPVVVDRGVVADALGEVAQRAARLPAEQVTVTLRRRSAAVGLRPLNGARVPVDAVEAALPPVVERWGLTRGRTGRAGRPLPVRVAVADRGTVAS
jgi:hypothetical protein